MSSFSALRALFQTALLGLVLAATATFAESPAGKVDLFKGEVEILDAKGKATSRVIQKGTPFFLGETIRTQAGGRVKLIFEEGGPAGRNTVVLGASAVLKIERASTAASGAKTGTSLSLAAGELRADVKRKYSGEGGDSFEVKTRNAVAGVRGTVFVTRINPQGMTEVATERGAVAVRALSGQREVMVQPGMFAAVAAAGQVSPPRPISANPALNQVMQSLGGSDGGSSSPSSQESSPSAGSAERPPEKPEARAENSAARREERPAVAPAATGSSEKFEPARRAGPPPGALAREPVVSASDGGRSPASVGASPRVAAPVFMGQQRTDFAPRAPVSGAVTDAMRFIPGNQAPGTAAAQIPVGPPPQARVIIELK